MTIKTFYNKYQGRIIDDWGCVMSDEAKQMCKDFKAMLKDELKEFNPKLNITPNHYDWSGMIEIDNKHIYIDYSINRHYPNNLNDSSCRYGILIRNARHSKDWKGCGNHFCNIFTLKETLKRLLEIRECELSR